MLAGLLYLSTLGSDALLVGWLLDDPDRDDAPPSGQEDGRVDGPPSKDRAPSKLDDPATALAASPAAEEPETETERMLNYPLRFQRLRGAPAEEWRPSVRPPMDHGHRSADWLHAWISESPAERGGERRLTNWSPVPMKRLRGEMHCGAQVHEVVFPGLLRPAAPRDVRFPILSDCPSPTFVARAYYGRAPTPYELARLNRGAGIQPPRRSADATPPPTQ